MFIDLISVCHKAARDEGAHWGNSFLTRERGFPITYHALLRNVCPRVSAGSGRASMYRLWHCRLVAREERSCQTVLSPQFGSGGT